MGMGSAARTDSNSPSRNHLSQEVTVTRFAKVTVTYLIHDRRIAPDHSGISRPSWSSSSHNRFISFPNLYSKISSPRLRPAHLCRKMGRVLVL